MKKTNIATIIAAVILMSPISFADSYCPQGFDVTCGSNNSCTYSNYLPPSLSWVPHSKVNGTQLPGTYKGMVLTQAQWSKTQMFGISIQCFYQNSDGHSFSTMASNLSTNFKADTAKQPNSWSPRQPTGAYLCYNAKTELCPFSS